MPCKHTKEFYCENCGKLHDGRYGSGRFCSEHCRYSHMSKKVKRRVNNLPLHPKTRSKPGGWTCNLCGKVYRTRRLLEEHKKTDKHPGGLSRIPWNKGLTKDDPRVAKGVHNASEWRTDQRRHEQSLKKKKFYSENPEKHPNRILANNRSHMSYPERVVFDWLVKHNIQFEHQYRLRNRFVDFYVPSMNLLLEVDGAYWHDKETDDAKDAKAVDAGYKTLRISASEKIEDRLMTYFFT